MRIGVDIDCTMNQFLYEYIFYCKKICKLYNHEYMLDLSKYSIKDQFQFSDSLYEIFMKTYFPITVNTSKLAPACKDVLSILSNYESIELFCITSRDADYNSGSNCYKGQTMKNDTFKWFNKNSLPFNEYNTYFSVKDKGKKCKELSIDIMIEDNPSHIQECIDNGIECYFPIYEYNKYFINTNIAKPMYNGWIDILNIIK